MQSSPLAQFMTGLRSMEAALADLRATYSKYPRVDVAGMIERLEAELAYRRDKTA